MKNARMAAALEGAGDGEASDPQNEVKWNSLPAEEFGALSTGTGAGGFILVRVIQMGHPRSPLTAFNDQRKSGLVLTKVGVFCSSPELRTHLHS